MAPKTPKGGNSEQASNDEAARNITVLCHLMACGEGSTTAELAPILGLSHAKNVPRKINSIINPYGFEYKGGKVVKKDGAAAPAAAGAGAPSGSDGLASPPGDASQETPVKAPKKRTPTPKKRKLDEVKDEDRDVDAKDEEMVNNAEV